MRASCSSTSTTRCSTTGSRGACAAGDVRGVRRLFGALGFGAWLAAYREANGRLWASYGRGEIGREELHRRRFADPLAAFGFDREAAEEVGAFYLERTAGRGGSTRALKRFSLRRRSSGRSASSPRFP